MSLIVAAVRTGSKYPVGYVLRLMAGFTRHLRVPFEFHVLTDQPDRINGAVMHDIANQRLNGWWGKMALFEPSWRAGRKVLYMDLDNVMVGPLDALANLQVDFGICRNFTQLAGNKNWPCRYGSCTMLIGPDARTDVWTRFQADRYNLMASAGAYGDQKVIELLAPDATYLQDCLPHGFFHGYRHLTDEQPDEASVVVFAGSHKPHNTHANWVREEWEA